MNTLLLALTALADTPTFGTFYEGLAADAPAAIAADAVVPILASDTGSLQASLGDEALVVSTIVSASSGNTPTLGLHPPTTGWPEGSFEITVSPGDSDPEPLALTAGADPAGPPMDPVVLEVGATDWGPDDETPLGCCHPTRLVAIEVDNPDADPWSYVQLRGELVQPGTGIDAGFGPGSHLLTFTQWEEDGVLYPACFEVVGVSASGAESAPIELCPEADLVGTESNPRTGGGCASAPVPAIPILALALAFASRRVSRTGDGWRGGRSRSRSPGCCSRAV